MIECVDAENICSPLVVPSEERCNGLDDDCDSLVDEFGCDCMDGKTEPCGPSTGECRPGTRSCQGGRRGAM